MEVHLQALADGQCIAGALLARRFSSLEPGGGGGFSIGLAAPYSGKGCNYRREAARLESLASGPKTHGRQVIVGYRVLGTFLGGAAGTTFCKIY